MDILKKSLKSKFVCLFGVFFMVGLLGYVSPAQALEPASKMPELILQTVTGNALNTAELKGKEVVFEWFNPDCPFVKKHYKPGSMQALQQKAAQMGVIWLTVSSTKSGHESHLNPKRLQEVDSVWKLKSTHVIDDASGVLGKLFNAKTTPHIFVFDRGGALVYQGAIDSDPAMDSDPAVATNYLSQVLDSLRQGGSVAQAQTKPYGCSVKY